MYKAALVIRKDQYKFFQASIEKSIDQHLDVQLFPSIVNDTPESEYYTIELSANTGYALYVAGKNFAAILIANNISL